MVELLEVMDYVWMMAWAALFGSLGGVGAQIIAARQHLTAASNTNTTQTDQSIAKTSVSWASGWFGSAFLGAIAAIISLYFLAPITTTTTVTDGVPTSVDRYDVIRLVALSLIVGAAGQTVIVAAQARITAAIQSEKAQTTMAVAQSQVDVVGKAASQEVDDLVAKLTESLKASQPAATVLPYSNVLPNFLPFESAQFPSTGAFGSGGALDWSGARNTDTEGKLEPEDKTAKAEEAGQVSMDNLLGGAASYPIGGLVGAGQYSWTSPPADQQMTDILGTRHVQAKQNIDATVQSAKSAIQAVVNR